MIRVLKDHYRVGQFLAILFIVGIAFSLYEIYSLPYGLSLSSGYHPAFKPVYVVLGLTFVLGSLTIYYTLYNKREIVVFRDKRLEDDIAAAENANSILNAISLDSVKERLKAKGTIKEIINNGLQAICKQLEAGQGAIYMVVESGGLRKAELKGGYALSIAESTVVSYEFGEGLIGQAAAGGKTLYVDEVPEGYIRIISGLGSASPRYLLIVPIKRQENVVGVMEIATFTPVSSDQRKYVEESADLIAEKVSNQ